MPPFLEHSGKGKTIGTENKSMVAKQWKKREELTTTRGSGVGGTCTRLCDVYKDHTHLSKLTAVH